MVLSKLSRGLSFLGIVVQSHLKAAVRVLSLLGIVVQSLQKAPLVWTLIILGVVVQTFGVGICREDFWVLWSIFLHSRHHRGSRELLRLCRWTNGADSARPPLVYSRLLSGTTEPGRGRREAAERTEIG